jgi:hypothetical protein
MPSPEHSSNTSDRMPTDIPCDVEYHRLAHKAVWYLLERISAEDELSTGDRHVCEFLRYYFNAWASEIPKNEPSTSAIAIRGVLCLLDASRENVKMPKGYLGLVDTLFMFVHTWARDLRALSSSQPNALSGSSPRENP